MLVVAGEELEGLDVVAGDEALDLVEDGHGLERAEAWLEILSGEPYSVAIGLARLPAAGLAHVGAEAFAEGNQRAHVGAGLVGDADDHLQLRPDPAAVACLLYL